MTNADYAGRIPVIGAKIFRVADVAMKPTTTNGARAASNRIDPATDELIKLRHFAGLTNDEVANILGISPRKATQVWAYACAWRLTEIEKFCATFSEFRANCRFPRFSNAFTT